MSPQVSIIIERGWRGHPLITLEGSIADIETVLKEIGEDGRHTIGTSASGLVISCTTIVGDHFHFQDEVGDPLPYVTVDADGTELLVETSDDAAEAFRSLCSELMRRDFPNVGYAEHEFIFSDPPDDPRALDAAVTWFFESSSP